MDMIYIRCMLAMCFKLKMAKGKDTGDQNGVLKQFLLNNPEELVKAMKLYDFDMISSYNDDYSHQTMKNAISWCSRDLKVEQMKQKNVGASHVLTYAKMFEAYIDTNKQLKLMRYRPSQLAKDSVKIYDKPVNSEDGVAPMIPELPLLANIENFK